MLKDFLAGGIPYIFYIELKLNVYHTQPQHTRYTGNIFVGILSTNTYLLNKNIIIVHE